MLIIAIVQSVPVLGTRGFGHHPGTASVKADPAWGLTQAGLILGDL